MAAPSIQTLQRIASETGYQADTVEKVMRLLVKRKLHPPSFCSLTLNPLKLRPLNWAPALAACCPLWPSPDGTPMPIKSAAQRGQYANRR